MDRENYKEWYFVDSTQEHAYYSVVIVQGNILTTREINRKRSYNLLRNKNIYDDLDIINHAYEENLLGKAYLNLKLCRKIC
ncbi:MAG: hypothetical protein WCD89_04430 [Anaerocolumna sp.]